MLKKLMNMKKKKGFTLIELIVVLVIMAILAAAAIPTMMHYVDEAKGSQHLAEARAVYIAATAGATEAMAKGPVTAADDIAITIGTSNANLTDSSKIIDGVIQKMCKDAGMQGDTATVSVNADGSITEVNYVTDGYTITIDGSGTATSVKNP